MWVTISMYAPEMCRLGGITALLTSSSFNENAKYSLFRESVLMNNDLVLANRFNNTLFKAEKTKVVTDVLFYQRVKNKPYLNTNEKLLVNTIDIAIDGKLYATNAFFNEFPSCVNGSVALGYFHNRPALTIREDRESLNDFSEKQLTQFELNLRVSVNRSLATTSSTSSSRAPLEEKNKLAQSDYQPDAKTVRPFTLQGDYVKNYTRLFFGSYNLDNNGNLWYYS
jgi:hypothetical protein